MKSFLKTSLSAAFAAVLLCGASPLSPRKYALSGETFSVCAGQEETRSGQVLHVTQEGSALKLSLDGFEMMGYKNMSIRSTLETDSKGNIISFRDVKVGGISGVKVKSISGTVTDRTADITLEGKAALVFNFTITYKGSSEIVTAE